MGADEDIARAAARIEAGGLVVYPTETVYGLAAAALDPEAVEGVFAVKGRARDKPVSLAVPTVEAARSYTRASPRERAFMDAFLPGPVTVLLERRAAVPDVLVAGAERVGVRVPDHPVALALLERVEPLTATSANLSGQPSARRVADIAPDVREQAFVLDAGETAGTESTVVDVSTDTIHRRGALADDIEAWLAAN
jgi:L-threonylcarbamoyladenylate synthase